MADGIPRLSRTDRNASGDERRAYRREQDISFPGGARLVGQFRVARSPLPILRCHHWPVRGGHGCAARARRRTRRRAARRTRAARVAARARRGTGPQPEAALLVAWAAL